MSNEMRPSRTAERIREAMEDLGLRQADVMRLVEPHCKNLGIKMNKSDLSQYLSGKFEPKQDKLMVLGLALGVSPAWLMGLDVPRTPRRKVNPKDAEEDARFLALYGMLSRHEKKVVRDLVIGMLNKGGGA